MLTDKKHTPTNFDDIRPYTEGEFHQAIKRISHNEWLMDKILNMVKSGLPEKHPWVASILRRIIVRRFEKIHTVDDFQSKIMMKLLIKSIIKRTTEGLSVSGIDSLDPNLSYVFVSNHRDIVLDAELLNYALHSRGMPFTQLAIGSNLLVNPLITDILKSNRAFIVKRGLSMREQLRASLQLSHYINNTLEGGDSIWIAEREGRAKDGNDRSNPAVFKMIFLAKRKGEESFSEFINRIRIVPVAVSYEKDPCDRLKAWSIFRKEDKERNQKREYEDMAHIITGVKRQKKRVHLAVGEPIAGYFKNEKALAKEMDRQIHGLYRLWPSNYIAYDAIHGTMKYKSMYSLQQATEFLSQYDNLYPPVRKLVLEAYAAPVKNFEELDG